MMFQTFSKILSVVTYAIIALLFTFSPAVAQAPPTPTHRYLMDEGIGNITTDSGSPGGVDGTLQDLATFIIDTPFSYAGNHAVHMDDRSDIGSIDIAGAIATGGEAWSKWSASMWAKRDGADTGWAGTLSSWSSVGGIPGDFQIRQHPTTQLEIIGRNSDGKLWTAGAGGMLWPADAWTHIALNVDHDAGQVEWYVNGTKATTQIVVGGGGGGSWSNTGQLIGSANVYAMLGPMDEVGIWGDRTLTDSEANYLFSNSIGSKIPSLLAKTFTWNIDASGDWNTSTNWVRDGSGDVPNSPNPTALFGSKITSPQIVYTNADVTVNAIHFNSVQTYGIVGLGSVSLEVTTADPTALPTIEVLEGSHEFQTTVNFHNDATVNVVSGSELTFNNALNLHGNTLTKTGEGTVLVRNDLVESGGLVDIQQGTVAGNGTIGGDVSNGGTIAPGKSPEILTIDGNLNNGESGTIAVEIKGTSGAGDSAGHDQTQVTGSSTLDSMQDTDAGENYADPTARSARDNFTLIASAAGSTGTFGTVNYNDVDLSADFTKANGSTRSHQGNGLFRNINYDGNNVSLTNLFALEGDADGDFDIDITDFNILASNFDDTGASAETNNWTTAGFDADGDIDITDFNFLAANFAPDGYGASAVPEPSSLLLTLLGLMLLAGARGP